MFVDKRKLIIRPVDALLGKTTPEESHTRILGKKLLSFSPHDSTENSLRDMASLRSLGSCISQFLTILFSLSHGL